MEFFTIVELSANYMFKLLIKIFNKTLKPLQFEIETESIHLYIQILYIQMNIETHIKTTRPLPEYQKAIINMIFTASFTLDELGTVLKSFDISFQQFNVLRILKGQKGQPANLSTIQERMIHKMSNTTRLVDKLASKNLVDRMICPTNRRKVEITITKKGVEFLDKVSPAFAKKEEQLTKNLTSKELSQLNILLDKLRN